jgi:hypothetical protein
MKHFAQFINLLRSAWEGDRARCLEQAYALADRLEGEGDTARARMLRFTLQSLQNQSPPPDMRNATMKSTGAIATAAAAPQLAQASGDGERVALTFGSWDRPQIPR